MRLSLAKKEQTAGSKEMRQRKEELISITLYNEEILQEKTVTLKELIEQKSFLEAREGYKLWINIDEGYDNQVVDTICTLFDIHPLVKEDIILKGQRPKVEEYEHYIFSIVKMIYYKEEVMKAEQLSFILGRTTSSPSGKKKGMCLIR